MKDRWFDEDLSGCRLGDGRLDSRLRQLVEQMESGFGESIPLACQDWANTKAAYRFFSNDRVSEEDILRGHFDATRAGSPPAMARSSFFMTRRSFPGGAGVLRRWASRQR